MSKTEPQFKLYRKQFINLSIDEVFSFYENPENLEKITPPNLNFSIKTTTPIEMKIGQKIDYVIKLKGIPIKWRSIISSYDPPYSFTDEQIKGPFSIWIHNHIFKKHQDGTLIIDDIKYSIPLGIIGNIVNFLFVKRDLENIFNYREKIIRQVFNKK